MVSQLMFHACLLVSSLLFDVNEGVHSHSFVPNGAIDALASFRGGGKKRRTDDASKKDAYRLLAVALKDRLYLDEDDTSSPPPDVESVEKALKSISSAQGALKTLDGAAHEAYQRTHRNTDAAVDTSVSGRARRSAARAGSTADALLAAELMELLEKPELLRERDDDQDDTSSVNVNGSLAGRQVVVNATTITTEGMNLTVLVLYEPSYSGGAGLDHGGIQDLLQETKKSSTQQSPRGRLLVVVADSLVHDLPGTMSILDTPLLLVGLHTGLVANEVASVQPNLYRAAGRLLEELQPTLQSYSKSGGGSDEEQQQTAIHFVGRSLAGGVASLAATISDGSLPMPTEQGTSKKKRRRKKHSKTTTLPKDTTTESQEASSTTAENTTTIVVDGKNETDFALEGYGQGRSSAMVLGVPPCLSANVKAAFVTSFIYGDDVVCRATQDSLDRLSKRTRKTLKSGIFGRQMGWMTDAVSLTVSSLKTHAHGSEGEEARLAVPGQVYLVRPRRLGGVCSIHEVGGLKGGREALRAAVLWQLHDILLSRSLWRHHDLNSYIHGLDRVQLRGFDESSGDGGEEHLH